MNILITLPTGIISLIIIFLVLKNVFSIRTVIAGSMLALFVILALTLYAIIDWPGPDVFAIHLSLYLMTIYALSIISKIREDKGSEVQGRFHWGPATIIGFFAIVLVTNTFFILLAQSDGSISWIKWIVPEPRTGSDAKSVFPGTVSHNFRERENQFNEYQQQRDLQKQRGWVVKPGWQGRPVVGEMMEFIIKVTDSAGKPVENARVNGKFLYPGNYHFDKLFTMAYKAEGVYVSKLKLDKPGDWDLVVIITKNKNTHELRVSTTVH